MLINHLEINVIEVLTEQQLHELSQLLVDVVQEGASIGFMPPLALSHAKEYWHSVVEDDSVILWIATLDDKICGSVQLHLSTKENGLHRAEVAKLMVHPSKRMLGIATQLLEVVEQYAGQHNRSLLILDTREGDPSNTLYQKQGYIVAGKIPLFARSSSGELATTVLYYKLI